MIERSDCLPHPRRDGWNSRKLSMPLAPIRGAPPGAPNPNFPIEEPRAKPAQLTAAPASGDQPPISPMRRRQTPIEIGGSGIVLKFRVIPELPAIARASMTVHMVADAVGPSLSHTLGVLRMSAANARAFLTDLRNGRSPIVATGDEDGTVQIEFEITEAGPVLLARKPGQRQVLHRWVIDRSFDLKTTADELRADLGAWAVLATHGFARAPIAIGLSNGRSRRRQEQGLLTRKPSAVENATVRCTPYWGRCSLS
jgi:hypothetical protein